MIPLRKLYRPENTVQGERDLLTLRSDINEVFWTEDLEVIPAKWVEGKCIVREVTYMTSTEAWGVFTK